MGLIAAVGSAVVGAGASVYGANKAEDAANRAQDKADAAQAEALDFERQRHAEWQSIYGDTQQNLADYYDGLSASSIAAQHIQGIEQERSVLLSRVSTNMAQRGLTNSGLAAQAETQIEMSTIEQRASARAHAPMEAAQQKSQFLQIGLGQNPANNVSGALQRGASAQQNLANSALQQSNSAANAAGNAVATSIASVGNHFLNNDSKTTRPGVSTSDSLALGMGVL